MKQRRAARPRHRTDRGSHGSRDAGQPPARPRRSRWIDLAICVCLATATLAIYAQVRTHDFVAYDDPELVTANRPVAAGLSVAGVAWAFTTIHEGNWLPLTWLSHMADVQLFGLRSAGHHWTSVVLHVLNALLLFGVLAGMTGARWRSALVAFLFALHPLRVESVAWVAERKDVLSALFWMLTIWAYAAYVGRPSARRYLLVVVVFSLGLMAKSMIVTLPFVLLLLDWWPLGRWSPVGGRTEWRRFLTHLIREKAPLLALAAGVSAVTLVAQRSAGAVASSDAVPLLARLADAVVSYVVYLRDMIWPARLAVFYPLGPIAVPVLAGAAALLLVVSAVAVREAPRRPYVTVGWLWYVGTLVPVIGLVQVGAQSHADRYTYVPMIGVAIAVSWGLAEIAERWPRARLAIAGLACAACVSAGWLTWRQLSYWQNSLTLFSHAIEVTDDNYVGYLNVGLVRRQEGRLDDALANYERAARIRPTYAEAQNDIAEVLLAEDRIAEALPHIAEALRLRPGFVDAQVNLGVACSASGRLDEAIAAFEAAVRLAPENAAAHAGLGDALRKRARLDEALPHLAEAVRLEPGNAGYHVNLGAALEGLGRTDEAIGQFAEAVRLRPDDARAHFDLGAILAGHERFGDAAREFGDAVRLKPDFVKARVNLGSALATLGRLDEAIIQFREALRLQPDLAEARRNLEYAIELRGTAPGR